MPATIDLTEQDIFTALRSFWLLVLPSGVEVIRAQVNRVPEPKGLDFVVMNSSMRQRIQTNTETWDITNPDPTAISALDPAMVTIQCDVHGPNGADNAWAFATMFRSAYACGQFAGFNPLIQPLWVPDPKQLPFTNGEQQYEDRWVVEPLLQANASVSVTQDFAATASVGLINVDATYPPGDH